MKKLNTIIILVFFTILSFGQTRIYAPDLREPINGSSGQNPDVVLDWDAVTGQTTNITYELQLASTADFSDAETFPRTDGTALTMSELMFGHTYYWRVKAYDDEDPSDWSETWMFKVVSTVDISNPKIGKEVYTTQEIQWDKISGLTNYEIQIDTVYEWIANDTLTSDDVLGTFVLDATNMWLVGEGGLIMYFDGTSWVQQDGGTTEDLNSVFFTTATNGFAVGTGGTVLNFDGSNWTVVDAGTSADLSSVYFVDDDHGWVVGAGGAIIQYDTGVWSEVTSPTTEDLTGVTATGASDVWACGTGKMVVHFDGNEWTSAEVGSKDHNAISFADASNGWVVSKSGKINYYNGMEWVEQESATNKDLYAVHFDGMNGFAVGKSGTMVSYSGDWREVSSESSSDIYAIWTNGDGGLTGGKGGTVVVKTGEGFNSPYLKTFSASADTGSYELANLLFGKTIYYRMRAIHASDMSAWTGGRSIFTFPAPELDKPSNGSDDTDMDLLFKWDEYEGATEYTWQISFDEDFTTPIVNFSDSNSLNYSVKYFGTDYYWRVGASNANDVSDWSEVWSFTTINTVNLVSPEDGETDVSKCPNYEWDEIIGASSYELWIDKDPDFSAPATEITTIPSFQCNNQLDRKTMYYWKVRGLTNVDTTDWSETWSFEVEGYTSIGDDFSSGSVDLYPNPSENGSVTLTINSYANSTYSIAVVDMTGRMVNQIEVNCKAGENNIGLALTDEEAGLYLVKISIGDKIVTKKLFLE